MNMKNTIQNALALVAVGALSLMIGSCNDGGADLTQFDRTGIPAVNTAVIPAGMKDAFNLATPAADAQFVPVAEARITALRNAVGAVVGFPPEDVPGLTANQIANVLLPDVLTIDFSQPVGFPNGRTLTDDVVDVALGLVLNRGNVLGGGPGVSDGLANDSTFSNLFPYLGAPQN